MKHLLTVLKNLKEAHAALQMLVVLRQTMKKNKSKAKKGPKYQYGPIGKATVEIINIIDGEQV